MKDQSNNEMVEERRSIVKADSRSAITFMEIPEDILVQILVRLPVDSLMRFKCVSKTCSSLISSRCFTDLFFKFSSSKEERRVFVYAGDRKLFSSSLSNLDAIDYFHQLNHDLTLSEMEEEDNLLFVNAIRGLICFRVRAGIRIINLATRQVLRLPQVEYDPRCNRSVAELLKWHCFGYDPVNDEYKVLNIISYINKFFSQVSISKYARKIRSETQVSVLVLGVGTSWRNTKISTSLPLSHCPYAHGISFNGVLYYGAWFSHTKRCVLMSFDWNSEEFKLIKFPMEAHVKGQCFNLMNYQDQVAVMDDYRLKSECVLDLWALEDAGKSEWSHKVFVFPYHKLRLGLDIECLKIKGTGRKGEIWLSERCGKRNKTITLAIYDVEKTRVKRVFVIEPPCPSFWFFHLFLDTYLSDDIENIMSLDSGNMKSLTSNLFLFFFGYYYKGIIFSSLSRLTYK